MTRVTRKSARVVRDACLAFWFLIPSFANAQQTVRIGVMSLFHPLALVLSTPHPASITMDGNAATVSRAITVHATPNGIVLSPEPSTSQPSIPAHTVTLNATTVTLTVPGKLTRTYRGGLTITERDGVLVPVVRMDVEVAVASIVAAESPPDAPRAALEAQAIVSRSFLLATRPAHMDFDACDTTHCQFLRAPPPRGSAADKAAHATRGMVLTWRSSPGAPAQIVAAMYSRSCGGHTREHLTANSYPFRSVKCSYCLRHPEQWTRAAPATSTEAERLAYNRTHGWSAIPSNAQTATGDRLTGRGTGHGVGMCQLGAADLARHGQSYQQILTHFFPDTSVAPLPE